MAKQLEKYKHRKPSTPQDCPLAPALALIEKQHKNQHPATLPLFSPMKKRNSYN